MLDLDSSHDLCIDYTCVLKKLKESKQYNIPLQDESLEFRLKFIQELSKKQFQYKHNLNYNQYSALNYFIKNRPFLVLEADKNIGVCIISKELENRISLDTLNDTSVYQKLNKNPLEYIKNSINNTINSLSDIKAISERLAKLIIIDSPKISNFRILPKLHKKTFGIRPIINSIDSATSKICRFMDLILQPFIRNTVSYLQDSQHLLQIFDKLDVTPYENLFQYSCDFSALYTNIKLDLAMELIISFITEYNCLDFNHLSLFGFKQLLLIIFNYNVFKYKNNYYKQVSGIAMGSCVGPTIANIVVYMLERSWLYIHKPLVYKRYIDDIYILSCSPIDLNSLKSSFNELVLNIISESNVVFLDLNIYIDSTFNYIKTYLYTKPTQTFSYLKTNSNHNKTIFKNIPLSLFIRVRRICINYHYFLSASRKLISQLIQRGYSINYLISLMRNVANKNRNDLLPYKNKIDTNINSKDFWFIVPFNKCDNNINPLIYNSFNDTNCIYDLNNINISIGNSVNPNLGSLFIHKKSFKQINFNFCSKSCNLINCKYCNFMEETHIIKFNNNFCLPILNNSDCNSIGCVYIIFCNLCNVFYVGETGNSLNSRFYNHIYSIKKFLPFETKHNEIPYHFNLRGHNYLQHMRIYIFKSGITDKYQRLCMEAELIHIFLLTKNRVINSKLIHNIEHFFTSKLI